MAGIKETKELLRFVFSVVEAVKESLSDGDMDIWDAKNFLEPLSYLAEAIDNIDEVLPELQDLDEGEVMELVQYCMEELDIGGDINVVEEVEAAKQRVTDALTMGKALLSLVQ